MSKECIENCPNIKACYKNVRMLMGTGGPLPVGIGYGDIDQLMDWTKASYNCPGPLPEITTFEKSFPAIRRILRKETSLQITNFNCAIEK